MDERVVSLLICFTLAWATSSSESRDPSTLGDNSNDDPNMQTRDHRWMYETHSNRKTRPSSQPSGDLPHSNNFLGEHQNVAGDKCSCGEYQRRDGRIIGGHETVYRYPFVVAYRMKVEKYYTQMFCMGLRISPERSVSGAHCFKDKGSEKKPEEVVENSGSYDQTERSTYDQLIHVIEITIHPEYDIETYANDIAIVTTEHEVDMTKASIACLFRSDEDMAGQRLKILGWGKMNDEGDVPDVLQEGEVEGVAIVICKRMGAFIGEGRRQLCTTTKGQQAHEGDSGGGVYWEDPATNRLYAVGIVSYDTEYNKTSSYTDVPSVNTKVSAYVPWIEKTVQEAKGPNWKTCNIRPRTPIPVY